MQKKRAARGFRTEHDLLDSKKVPAGAYYVMEPVIAQRIFESQAFGNCFFDGNKAEIVGSLADTIRAYPWVFAIGLFALSVVLFSQASTVAALVPVGIALGLPAASLIAMFPAVNGYFFLPTYGTIVAPIAFDRTGTTHIGRFVLSHSFMLPGLVCTISAVLIGLLISTILF